MAFNHEIDGVIYQVDWYRMDEDGDVTDWCLRVGLQEMPYDHLSPYITQELEEQCRLDDAADALEGMRFAAECMREAA